MLHLKLLWIIISPSITFIWAGYIQDKLFDEKAVKVVRLGNCFGTNLPFQFYFQFSKCNVRSVLVSNGTVVAKEDLKDKLKIDVMINRCRSRENLDSCEVYYKIENHDYCPLIAPNVVLPASSSPLAAPFQPILKCPIKKGIYRAYNFTFDLTPFMMAVNLDGWYWRVKTEIVSPKENNRRLSCTDLEGYTHF